MGNEDKPKVPVRDEERFIDISGTRYGGRPKAHVLLRHFVQYSDGKIQELQLLTFDKPIVTVFSHAQFIDVNLDFHSNEDMDLRMTWEMLESYSNPENSVRYTPKEREQGFFIDKDGNKKMVYYHVFHLVLSPIGKEEEYQIQCFEPVMFNLGPGHLRGEPSVLKLSFLEDSVFVANDLDSVDVSGIRHEAEEEVRAELHGKRHPTDS